MSDILKKSEMSEEDIKLQFITPALTAKWNVSKITMETSPFNKFTDGKVHILGKKAGREKAKKCDYILWYNKTTPLAIVEAKDNSKISSFGLQQAIDYGKMLNCPFVYSSNGDSFFEHDFITGQERELPLNQFPTEEELYNRWKGIKEYPAVINTEKKDSNTYLAPLYYNEDLISADFYSGMGVYPPRYYQRNAVNRVLSAIANNQNRILLVMATGTGKTYTAFQLVWRLIESKRVSKVLYLADRNNLVDQSIQGDFAPLEKVIHKINFQKDKKEKLSAYQVYFALYQQLDGHKVDDEEEESDSDEEIESEIARYKEFFNPDFFDLIIVDECHRGSARADSRWRKILEYFSSSIQVGMTATPKETKYLSNIAYFGDPVYTYSLKQGIEDGFLAPFKVINVRTSIDDGWRPKKGQKDVYGNEIEDREYALSDFDYNIILQDRIDQVAREITKYLKETDRMAKTIVFCPRESAAERMRVALNNLNTDMVVKDENGQVKDDYVVRITGGDDYGKSKLEYFISVKEKYPVIATTSKLLSTGTDCKMVKLIVIDEMINSMTEFKQIIGRGTRLRFEDGKTHFTIMDFRRVSRLFADPEWDGDVMQNENYGASSEEKGKLGNGNGLELEDIEEIDPDSIVDIDGVAESTPKYVSYVDKDGCTVEVLQRMVSVYDTKGKLLRQESIQDYTKDSILGTYQTLDNFIKTWSAEEKKEKIRALFLEKGIDLESIKEDQKMSDVDDYDFICHIAFDQKPLTRRERAEKVKKRDVFGKYGEAAREVINALLDKYAELGVYEIETTEILKQAPFDKFGKPSRIAQLFGGNREYWQALREIESELYKIAS